MKFKVFTLCVITQVFISTTFAEYKIEATVDLLELNPDVAYFVTKAGEKFVTTFLEWSHEEKKSSEGENEGVESVWIKDAKVEIVNGERQYEIRIKVFDNDSERKSYAHVDCLIKVQTNALDPYEVDCYVFRNR